MLFITAGRRGISSPHMTSTGITGGSLITDECLLESWHSTGVPRTQPQWGEERVLLWLGGNGSPNPHVISIDTTEGLITGQWGWTSWFASGPSLTPPWGLAPPYSLVRMEVLVLTQPSLVWVGEGLQYFLWCLVPQKGREVWKQEINVWNEFFLARTFGLRE